LLGAVPIALAANITRIAVTAVLYDRVGKEAGDLIFHDLAGWLMMPLALGLMGLEVWVLTHLLLEEPSKREVLLQLSVALPDRND
jgi:exosortase/archaeosortase family protein